jgi:phospholipid/cholesterol/gamma-HCH transport system substrate-binding protein
VTGASAPGKIELPRNYTLSQPEIYDVAVGDGLVFTIGEQQNLFASKTSFHALFNEVGGLRSGSPVRINGVNVGTVTAVDLGVRGKIRVVFSVRDDAAVHIREGSVASTGQKGMLGDRLLQISVGAGKPIPAGGRVPAAESTALSDYVEQAGRLLRVAEDTADNISAGTAALGDPEFGSDIRRSARDLSRILETVAKGRGPVWRLVTDRKMAAALVESIDNLQLSSERLVAAADDISALTRQARTGDGTLHELLYGQKGTLVIENLAAATGELADLLNEVRTGDGTVHRLIYTDEGGDLLTNLTAISEDLKTVTAEVRAGRGTLGSLLQDPSLYEDLKRLVGDLERNKILKALVRYSIKRDE